MGLKTSISIRYLSDITNKAARDARAFKKLEKIGKKSLNSLSRHARKSLKDLGAVAGKVGGLGGGAAIAGGATILTNTGGSLAEFRASAGLNKEDTKRIEKKSHELANALNTSAENLINLAETMQGKIGNIDLVLTALEPTAYAARGGKIIDRPDDAASLAQMAYLSGSRTAYDFAEFFSKKMLAGQSGSFTLEEQSNVSETLQAAMSGYLQGQRSASSEEFDAILQSARNYFKSADTLSEGFKNTVTDLYASPIFKGAAKDGDGNVQQFGDVMEKIYQKLDGKIDAVYNLEGISIPTKEFLKAYFLDRNGVNNIQRVQTDIEATEGSDVITEAARIASGHFGAILSGTLTSLTTRLRFALPFDGVDGGKLSRSGIKEIQPPTQPPVSKSEILVTVKAEQGTAGKVKGTDTAAGVKVKELNVGRQ